MCICFNGSLIIPDVEYLSCMSTVGGADKKYSYVNSKDMHTKPVNGLQYTVQGKHSAGQNSVDSINMAVSSVSSNLTFVQVLKYNKDLIDKANCITMYIVSLFFFF